MSKVFSKLLLKKKKQTKPTTKKKPPPKHTDALIRRNPDPEKLFLSGTHA